MTLIVQTGIDVTRIVVILSAENAVGQLGEQGVGTRTGIVPEKESGIAREGVDHGLGPLLHDHRLTSTKKRWRPGSKRKSRSENEKLRPISLLSVKLGRRVCPSLA